jgi:SEC-C motif-containing protein
MSINDKCPCGSGIKYKKCCKLYHDGKVPKNALILMKSRYSAYALNNAKYIQKTSLNQDDLQSIQEFTKQTTFQNLEIIEFIDGTEKAYVTFRATLFSNDKDTSFTEKSAFIKDNNRWLYIDGELL